MKAYEYKIVDGSRETVEKVVNELAEQGWSLVGGAEVRVSSSGPYYLQTMVRPKDLRGPWD